MNTTYWNGTGRFEGEYKHLYSALVPHEGAASTEEGEDLRALSMLYYDAYNNGWGNLYDGTIVRDFAERLVGKYDNAAFLTVILLHTDMRPDPAPYFAELETLADEVIDSVWHVWTLQLADNSQPFAA